jgi:endoglucanase
MPTINYNRRAGGQRIGYFGELDKRGQKMNLLEKLVTVFGVSGSEELVKDIIREEIRPYVDEITEDKMGNLIARKKGKFPKIMLAAHMDEIGLITKSIDKEGRIFVSFIGGIEPLTMIGQRVHIQGEKGVVHGVVTTKDICNGLEVRNLPKMEDLYVETGLPREELKKRGIEIGSIICLEEEFYYLGSNDIICGKAFDNRLGCFILIETAKKLRNATHEIYYVFTVQEEIGLFGAVTSAYKVEPDWAIVVDVIEVAEIDGNLRTIGAGPCITIKDAAMLGHKAVNDLIKKTAKKLKIPLQPDVSDIGATDALSISITRGGVPTGVLTIPIKNVHTTKSIAHVSDIGNAINILVGVLKSPPHKI